jgi:transcriptional regulator with XRE-family HTH domain
MKDMTPRYRATNLEETLEAQGRTRAWLGRQLGQHRSYVVHVAKGRRTVSESTARRIAELLGVPFFMIFELSTDDETPSPEKEAA